MHEASFAQKTYHYFSQLEGNQHISGVYGLQKILDLISRYQVRTILELGLGIGSIAHCVVSYCKAIGMPIRYVGTEANDFCLKALPSNLGEYYPDIEIYENLDAVPVDLLADLVIVDGSDASLKNLEKYISTHAILFVEGCRVDQVEALKRYFSHAFAVEAISDFKNPPYGPFPADRWSGGGSIIFTQPTLPQKLHFLQEKITTTLRYRLWRRVKS